MQPDELNRIITICRSIRRDDYFASPAPVRAVLIETIVELAGIMGRILDAADNNQNTAYTEAMRDADLAVR